MKFLPIINFILTLLIAFEASGQIDSLTLCKKIQMIDAMIYQDFPKAMRAGDQIYESAKESSCRSCLSRAIILNGKIKWTNGDYAESINLLKEIIISTPGHNPELAAQAAKIIGNNYYYQAYYDSAISYYQKAYTLYEKLGDHSGMAVVLGNLSLMYHRKGDFKKTVEYILKDETLKEKFQDTPHEIGDFGGMGNFFSDSLYYEEVIADNLHALEVQLEKNDLNLVARIYLNLGVAYRQLKDYKTAAHYFVNVCSLHEKLGLLPFWDDAGAAYREANMKDSCFYFHKKSRKEFKRVSDLAKLHTLEMLGDAHAHFGQYDSALANYIISMKMNVGKNNRITIVGLHRKLAGTYLKMRRYRESEQHLLLGIALAQQVSLTNERNLYQLGEQLYEATGNTDKALLYQKQYSHLVDSLDQRETALTLIGLQAQYKTSKKVRELELLKVLNGQNQLKLRNRNITMLSLATVSFASVFFIVVFVRQRNKIKKKNIALDISNQEQAALLKEVHHRVKNNLQLIASLINLQSSYVFSPEAIRELERTKSRIMSIALIHQKLYQHETLSSINLKSFLEDLIRNILSTFSEEDRLKKKLNIASVKVDIETAISIGLIINELVTNSLKHGFSETHCLELTIALEAFPDKLILTVSDNGPGTTKQTTTDKEGGFGLRLVEILLKRMSGTLEVSFDNGSKSKIEILNFSGNGG